MPAAEWATIERGLVQRITALNLFLRDVYHEGRIFAAGLVPRTLVRQCRHFRREMIGVRVPHDCYLTVVGTDLVRGPNGRFLVLEDNLRVPSGVSYMLANRQIVKQVYRSSSSAITSARSISIPERCSPICARSPPRAAPIRISCC